MAIRGPKIDTYFGANLTELQRGTARAVATLDSYGRKIQRIGVGITAVFGVIAAAGATALAQVEWSTAQVATLMDDLTSDTIPRMRDEIVDLSVTFGQSFESMAKARYDIVSAGFRSIAESATVLAAANELALAGAAEVGITARLIVQALRAYGLEADKAAYVSDLFFQTVKLGLTTVPELADGLGRIFSTARAAGVGLEELQAAVSVLTVITGNTNESVNALNRLLFAMAAPASQAADAMREHGIEVHDAEGNIKSLIDVIKQFQDMNLGMIKTLIGGRVNAARAMAILSQNTQLYQNALYDMANATGTSRKATEVMMVQTVMAWRQMKQSVNELRVEIGKAVKGDVAAFIGTIRTIVGLLTRWVEKNQKLTASIITVGFHMGLWLLSIRALLGLAKLGALVIGTKAVATFTAAITASRAGVFLLNRQFNYLNIAAGLTLPRSFGLLLTKISLLNAAVAILVAGFFAIDLITRKLEKKVEDWYSRVVPEALLHEVRIVAVTEGFEELEKFRDVRLDLPFLQVPKEAHEALDKTWTLANKIQEAFDEWQKGNIGLRQDFQNLFYELQGHLKAAKAGAEGLITVWEEGGEVTESALETAINRLKTARNELLAFVIATKMVPVGKEAIAKMLGYASFDAMIMGLNSSTIALNTLKTALEELQALPPDVKRQKRMYDEMFSALQHVFKAFQEGLIETKSLLEVFKPAEIMRDFREEMWELQVPFEDIIRLEKRLNEELKSGNLFIDLHILSAKKLAEKYNINVGLATALLEKWGEFVKELSVGDLSLILSEVNEQADLLARRFGLSADEAETLLNVLEKTHEQFKATNFLLDLQTLSASEFAKKFDVNLEQTKAFFEIWRNIGQEFDVKKLSQILSDVSGQADLLAKQFGLSTEQAEVLLNILQKVKKTLDEIAGQPLFPGPRGGIDGLVGDFTRIAREAGAVYDYKRGGLQIPLIPHEQVIQELSEQTLSLADAWNILTKETVRAVASAADIYESEQMIFGEGADMFRQLAILANRANSDVVAAFADMIASILRTIKAAKAYAAGGEITDLIEGIGGIITGIGILATLQSGGLVTGPGVGHRPALVEPGEWIIPAEIVKNIRGSLPRPPAIEVALPQPEMTLPRKEIEPREGSKVFLDLTVAPEITLQGGNREEAEEISTLIAEKTKDEFLKIHRELKLRGKI